ncbi:VOC family protein [Qiania dongpingensis]|uniref:VOC family protein n=1 Tax=Qiania dongpingensis TaxID=2763669 RepID=A0A7G9G4E0_9FIRM|nr:VOC family protein [Qiania dongpingensis]QNM05672.1 VOC family protein [Qiania dongpingensis]
MNPIIKGIHHVGIKPARKDFEKVTAFYTGLLELHLERSWTKEGARGAMVSAGGGSFIEIIEVDDGAALSPNRSVHLAFHVSDTDEMISRVRNAGYEILVEPKDVCLPSEPPYSIRVGFCRGPAGEEIEFFCER